jgi:hypothetical protein
MVLVHCRKPTQPGSLIFAQWARKWSGCAT